MHLDPTDLDDISNYEDVPIGGSDAPLQIFTCQCQKCIVNQTFVTKSVLSYHFIVSLQYYAMFNNVIFTVNQAVIVFFVSTEAYDTSFYFYFFGGTQHIVTSVQSQTGFGIKYQTSLS